MDKSEAGNYTDPPTKSTSESTGIHFNKSYIRSIPGILKAVETICALVCMICSIASTLLFSHWSGVVSGIVFVLSFILYFLYLFNVIAKFPPARIFAEWIYYLLMSVLMLITSIIAATKGPLKGLMITFSVFGFICTAALILDLVLRFKFWFTERRTTSSHTTRSNNETAANEPKY